MTSIVVCSACGDPLTPGEALEVVTILTGAVRYVHRPQVAVRPDVPTGSCFHVVRPVNVDLIRLADPTGARFRDRLEMGRER
jgi:hypothetical protein